MTEISPELVINELLEQNKQQVLQISVMKSYIKQLQDAINVLQSAIEDTAPLMEA